MTGAWDYASLPKNVIVGRDCYLERRSSFERFRSEHAVGLQIGDGVKVYTWTVFNVEPTGRMEIGNGSELVGAVFMCAERIVVGQRVLISYGVTIADSDFHPRHLKERQADAIANAPSGDRSSRPVYATSPVSIEDDVQIGIGAIVLKGVRIGRGSFVEAGAVVTADVPAHCHVAGNPARVTDGHRS